MELCLNRVFHGNEDDVAVEAILEEIDNLSLCLDELQVVLRLADSYFDHKPLRLPDIVGRLKTALEEKDSLYRSIEDFTCSWDSDTKTFMLILPLRAFGLEDMVDHTKDW